MNISEEFAGVAIQLFCVIALVGVILLVVGLVKFLIKEDNEGNRYRTVHVPRGVMLNGGHRADCYLAQVKGTWFPFWRTIELCRSKQSAYDICLEHHQKTKAIGKEAVQEHTFD